MEWLLNEDQLSIQEMVRKFVDKEIIPNAARLDKEHRFPWDIYNQICDMGLQCMPKPEEYGGPGFDLVTQVMVAMEICRGDIGVFGALAANGLAADTMLIAANDDQKKRFFDAINEGKPVAFAVTEPNAGSDVSGLAATATKDGDDYILNGTKVFITNGGVSGINIVYATIDKKLGAKGTTAFMVEADRPGFSVGKIEDKMGLNSSSTAELVFQDCRVPRENMIGEETKAFKYAMGALENGRLMVAAEAVGGAQMALEHAIKYSKERHQFGRPICDFQAIQFMLADCEIKIEAARSMLYTVASLKDAGHKVNAQISAVKAFASEMALEVAITASQVMGAYGYTKDYPAEKIIRDVRMCQIADGTSQIHREIIARALLK